MSALQDNIDALNAETTRNTTVVGSALALINGFAARLDAAVAAAVAAGATQAQLTELNQLSAGLKSNDDQLAAAVAANTPAPPVPTPTPTSAP